jgi:hypothetical protein
MENNLAYGGFLERIATAFDASLSGIDVGYNFDHGIEFEIAMCQTLRRVLPQRFGVCRGYVITRSGEFAGDDIIIYDKMGYPTTRMLEEDFIRKEKVPIEAVMGYIEAKHTIQIEGDAEKDGTLARALAQVAKVKLLVGQREELPPLLRNPPDPSMGRYLPIGEGWPFRRNPFYAAIFSRFVKEQGCPEDPEVLNTLLLAQRLPAAKVGGPDLIVAGQSNLALPAVTRPHGSRQILSPFLVDDSRLAATTAPGIAYGVGLSHMLWALDNIELRKMPWEAILGNGLGIRSV